jgi:hypothetical protein
MVYDATWFKEYDRVYFEIWRRVTQQMVSTLHDCIVHQFSAKLIHRGSVILYTLYVLRNA